MTSCVICRKAAGCSGNNNCVQAYEENTELQKQRGEKSPLPDLTDPDHRPRGRGHEPRPLTLTENIQVDDSSESKYLVIISFRKYYFQSAFVSLANSKSINYV